MSLFARSFYGYEEPSFNDFFRLINDLSNEAQGHGSRHVRPQRVFAPRFDVRETETTYELHGELPGVDRENIQIEFTEPQTMVVKGTSQRNYTADTASSTTTSAASEFVVVDDFSGADSVAEQSETASHKATVADEDTEAAKEKGEVAAEKAAEPEKKVEAPKERFWYQERSIGSFSRTFSFPARVEEAAVTANLDNGILHVSIPKSAKHEIRRINIE